MSPKVVAVAADVLDEKILVDELSDVHAELSHASATTVDDLVRATHGADALIVGSSAPITGRVIEETDSLRVIGRAGIGVDNIDLERAGANDVTVVNVPDYCVEEVSTHAVSLLLSSVRKIPYLNTLSKSGAWDREAAEPIHRLKNETLGLIGFGKIPRRLVDKLSGFRMNVVAFDPYVSATEMDEYDVKKVSFESLLSSARYVSVHAPLTSETKHLFDVDAFEQMNDDAILVNTSRGPILDESALGTALRNDEIAGAALDVMESEPPIDSPLFDLDEVIITPHVGWYSEEARRELTRSVARDIVRGLKGESPASEV